MPRQRARPHDLRLAASGFTAALTSRCAQTLLVGPIGAAVVRMVVLRLSWMIFTAHAPGLMRLAALELEVVNVVGMLVAALVPVCVVALLRTRDR